MIIERFVFAAVLVIVTMASHVKAKELDFKLTADADVNLIDVDIEEAGALHDGGARGPRFETSKGEKLFRAIVIADVRADEQEVQARRPFYSRQKYRFSYNGPIGIVHVFQIKDVIRMPITVVNGGVVDFKIHFDATVPGLTYSSDGGEPVKIDRMAKLADLQEFGLVPQPFINNNSRSPRSVCLEQSPDPENPRIIICRRWSAQ